ncbi:transcriptional regulator [Bacillus sp. A301a_S52]|nr:transcriptional regulator [Bacillus sp. A301a_S52]
MNLSELHSGDNVFVIQRNPHTQSVAHIQEAHIVENPYSPGQLALFFREEYYPLSDEFAMYESYEEAEQAYDAFFNSNYSHTSEDPIQEAYE